MLEVTIDNRQVKKLIKKFQSVNEKGKEFFNLLGIKIDQMTQNTFNRLGARGGMPKWKPLSILSMHPHWKANISNYPKYKGFAYNPDRWNLRRGTSKSKNRYYNDGSNNTILRASGKFRESFKIINTKNNSLLYGTNHNIAKEIIGDRPVLFFTNQDYKLVSSLFFNFIKQKIL